MADGLFGMTPDMLQQQRAALLDKEAMQFAQMDPFQRANYGIYKGANQLGGAIGGMLGGTDPELERVTQLQSLLKGVDLSDPEKMLEVARQAMQIDPRVGVGLIQRAGEQQKLTQEASLKKAQTLEAMAKARAAEQEKLDPKARSSRRIGELTAALQPFEGVEDVPSDVLAARIELDSLIQQTLPPELAKGRKIAALETFITAQKGKQLSAPEQRKLQEAVVEHAALSEQKNMITEFGKNLIAEGLEPGSPEFMSRMKDYNLSVVKGKKRGEGTDISVVLPSAAKEAGKEVGVGIGSLPNQYDMRDSLKEAMSILDKGIYGGRYGPTLEGLTGYSVGVVGSQQKLENTQVFRSFVSNVVVPRLKDFGGNDTVEEMRMLERMLGGDTTVEPAAIKRVVESALRKVEKRIQRIGQQAADVKKGEFPLLKDVPGSAGQPSWVWNPAAGRLEPVGGVK